MLFLKFVFLCALFLELSPNCLLVSSSKKGNSNSKTGSLVVISAKNKGISDLCRRPQQYVPTFMLNIYKNRVKNKSLSASANIVVRSFPGKSKYKEITENVFLQFQTVHFIYTNSFLQ